MDDWEFISRYGKGFVPMLTKPLFDSYVPLNALLYYILLSVFGLSYIPFQLLVIIFHTLNAYLVSVIVRKETGNYMWGYAAMMVFGISSVSIDNIVWSMGINFVLSGTCVFLAYILFLKFNKKLIFSHIFLSGILLFLSPFVYPISLLYPLVFAVKEYVDKGKIAFGNVFYGVLFLMNITVLFLTTGHRIAQGVHTGSLTGIPLYVMTGVGKGVLKRLFLPDLYFLSGTTHITGPFRLLAFAFIVCVGVLVLMNWLKVVHVRRKRFLSLLTYSLLVIVPYLTIAPLRVKYGIEQSTIHRYTYLSYFFVLTFGFRLAYDMRNSIPRVLSVLLVVYLVSVHGLASYNFNRNWRENTRKDRRVTEDMRYLMTHNNRICDTTAKGIWNPFRISEITNLLDKGKKVQVLNDCVLTPENISAMPVDQETKDIYNRLISTYSVYDPPFSIPYSM